MLGRLSHTWNIHVDDATELFCNCPIVFPHISTMCLVLFYGSAVLSTWVWLLSATFRLSIKSVWAKVLVQVSVWYCQLCESMSVTRKVLFCSFCSTIITGLVFWVCFQLFLFLFSFFFVLRTVHPVSASISGSMTGKIWTCEGQHYDHYVWCLCPQN